MKYLSVITNFGCHWKCPYCIVKNNKINVPKTTFAGLKYLKHAIQQEKADIISVSGGGDPLHEYVRNKNYYRRLFSICDDMGIPLEMHTSYIDTPFPFEDCYRVVYHLSDIMQLSRIRRYGKEKVRVVFVVTEKFDKALIDAISDFAKLSPDIDELSFRQMVNEKYENTYYCYDYLKQGHGDKWYYIEQCDYNAYFVNGKIYYEYSKIRE